MFANWTGSATNYGGSNQQSGGKHDPNATPPQPLMGGGGGANPNSFNQGAWTHRTEPPLVQRVEQLLAPIQSQAASRATFTTGGGLNGHGNHGNINRPSVSQVPSADPRAATSGLHAPMGSMSGASSMGGGLGMGGMGMGSSVMGGDIQMGGIEMSDTFTRRRGGAQTAGGVSLM